MFLSTESGKPELKTSVPWPRSQDSVHSLRSHTESPRVHGGIHRESDVESIAVHVRTRLTRAVGVRCYTAERMLFPQHPAR